MSTYRSQKSRRVKTEAQCPRCGRPHTIYIYWTGGGRPRIRCRLCEAVTGRRHESVGMVFGR